MTLRLFRFRRFRTRLLVALLGLLAAVLGLVLLNVSAANNAVAHKHVRANLEIAAEVFEHTIQQRIDFLAGSARVMSGDYAFRQTLAADSATLSSALESYTHRVHAPLIVLLDPEGGLRAGSDNTMENENAGPFRYLIGLAKDRDPAEASDFSLLKDALHVLVVVPLYAPYPEVNAWFGLSFPIDRAFAEELKRTTRIEVSFVAAEKGRQPRMLATTLAAGSAATVARLAPIIHDTPLEPVMVHMAGDDYVTLVRRRALLGEDPIYIVLQSPLGPELEQAKSLTFFLGLMSLMTFLVATVVARRIARGVSQPVQQLAAHTQVIAHGDYAARIHLDRADELGQLADAMNSMSAGLAERDQVRDLLDKNVSPEVAAQLMRDGSALGGEEREVTILFADLRGFTTLSEKLPPPALLALLNRHLDRMSGAIEAHGGVIDKFIGDEIMALFGAPVAQPDAADRALAAALAMQRALADLNRELAAEGKSPLAIGIGVNTARVVAGNIGSHRRLNYSVIGDGVNVAARLQSETRKPEHGANIITSAATLAACRRPPASGLPPPAFTARPLGKVQVKGRAEAVEIFAVG